MADTPGMSNTRAALLALVVLLAASQAQAQFTPAQASAPAENFAVEFGLLYWKPTPEITITDDGLIAGEPIDFVGEFGIPNERFRELRFTAKPGRKHRIRVSHLPIRYSESAVLSRTITIGGQTFSGSTAAIAHVDWTLWRFGYEYDVVSGPYGYVGGIAEVKYNEVNATVENDLASGNTDVNVPVPTVGGVVRGYLTDEVSVTAEFTGLSLDRNDWRGKFYDLDVYTQLNFGTNFGIQLGRRKVTADYAVDADEGDLKLDGWYFGAALRF